MVVPLDVTLVVLHRMTLHVLIIHPNNTYVFLPSCPLYLLDLRIITMKPRSKETPHTYLIKSSRVGKISLVVKLEV